VLHNVDHLSGGIYANQLAPILLKDFITSNTLIKKDTSFFNRRFKQVKMVNRVLAETGTNKLINAKFAGDSIFKKEWEKYVGKYKLLPEWNFTFYTKLALFFGYKIYPSEIVRKDDALYLKSAVIAETKLKEHLPGLFFTNTGEAMDFRNKVPTYGNIKLKKY